ncbi:MAG: hypothetical protein JO269_09520 [Burkholderiaceae bacterium]|nr:hypothetical protein [Burkholderiaceae bacterium]
MEGHRQILQARKSGHKPSTIFFDIGFEKIPARFEFEKPERALDYQLFPTVFVEQSEVSMRHDLRFIVGVNTVVCSPSWSDGLLDFLEKMTEARPLRITACCIREGREIMIWERGNWRSHA